ncbi:hypothetical protein FNW02_33865 [Komarekiella sp. 'clone 1']|uniref:Uncharacterized protein n=1 Tax=Komarekiella delphini-convector SJRDD-AB1 TaxID=2593771 RepID=A0AA40VUY1_9NOST|nr:hypothetical protein [Komarekiella delphini-convector]MBD6620625.1 hypothetical protein [Komarekiella delphini-convector SJRDD-AB1]
MTPEETQNHQDLIDDALELGMFLILQLDENEIELNGARLLACFDNSNHANKYLSKLKALNFKNVSIAWNFAKDGGEYLRSLDQSLSIKNKLSPLLVKIKYLLSGICQKINNI